MKRKLRMGVIGLGMGRAHVAGYKSHPQAEMVAVCDINERLLDSTALEFSVPQKYMDAGAMFEKADLDAVSVALPNKFHASMSIAALEAGLHVLCEKPMAMNAKEAERMNTAAAKARKNLMVNFSFRFTDPSYALKQQVDAGMIGDIYFGRTVWHRRRGWPVFDRFYAKKELAGGGPLIDLGVHRLDLALWLMNYPEIESVSGSTFNYLASSVAEKLGVENTVEDLACGLCKFKNGASLIVEASWALHIQEPEHMITLLCGTKGGLVQKNVGGGYNFTCEVYTEEGGNHFTKTLDRASVSAPSSFHEFINSILEKRLPLATGEQGMKVMQILDGIYRSAETGREVRVR